jgi:hypothetical protein
MATDAADRVEWLLELPAADAKLLVNLRHWPRLRIASDGPSLWIDGFKDRELDAVGLQSLPSKRIWRKEGPLLFARRSIAPSRKAPALLWTPIARGIPLQLPAWNHAHAEAAAPVNATLIRSATERPAAAMLIDLEDLESYILTAPAIRLKALQWTILAGKALVAGTPLLPVAASSYWADGNFLIPAGFDFEFLEIRALLALKLNSGAPAATILWHEDGTWTRISATAFSQLSIGSFRQTVLLTNRTGQDGQID